MTRPMRRVFCLCREELQYDCFAAELLDAKFKGPMYEEALSICRHALCKAPSLTAMRATEARHWLLLINAVRESQSGFLRSSTENAGIRTLTIF